MDDEAKALVLKLIGDVGFLLDEAELVSTGCDGVIEYVVSDDTIDDLRSSFMALKKKAV